MGRTPTIEKTVDTRMNTTFADENIFYLKNKNLKNRILGITEK
jgi:hypothetical protein